MEAAAWGSPPGDCLQAPTFARRPVRSADGLPEVAGIRPDRGLSRCLPRTIGLNWMTAPESRLVCPNPNGQNSYRYSPAIFPSGFPSLPAQEPARASRNWVALGVVSPR